MGRNFIFYSCTFTLNSALLGCETKPKLKIIGVHCVVFSSKLLFLDKFCFLRFFFTKKLGLK